MEYIVRLNFPKKDLGIMEKWLLTAPDIAKLSVLEVCKGKRKVVKTYG